MNLTSISEKADNITTNMSILPKLAEMAQNNADISTVCSEKLDALNALPNIPERFISNGSVDVVSYLAHAKELIGQENFDSEDYYNIFEAIFRGPEENIKEQQKHYIPYLLENTNIVNSAGSFFLDAGCGRGEFLSLLSEHNFKAKGVDINEYSIARLRAKGFDVAEADIIEYLKSVEDNTLIGLSSFQVIEHLTKEYVKEMINLAYEKISNKGVIILETFNPYCYTSCGSFYIDPTHISLISPDDLKFTLEYAGFKNVKIIFCTPVYPNHASKVDMRCNYIEYAAIATVNKD